MENNKVIKKGNVTESLCPKLLKSVSNALNQAVLFKLGGITNEQFLQAEMNMPEDTEPDCPKLLKIAENLFKQIDAYRAGNIDRQKLFASIGLEV